MPNDYDPLKQFGSTVDPNPTVNTLAFEEAEAQIKSDQLEEEERKRRLQEEQKQIKQQADQQKQQAEQKKNEQNPLQKLTGAKNPLEHVVNTVTEPQKALVGGFADFAEGIGEEYHVNWLKDLPSEQNRTWWGQAARSFVEQVGPVLAATFLTKGAVKGIAGRYGFNLTNKVADGVATFALGEGVGAGIGYLGRSSKDHNIAGAAKKWLPDVFGWIPDDIATLDRDSPDIKRGKNVLEGLGIGVVASALEGSLKAGIRFLARDAKSAKYLDDIAKKQTIESDNPILDYVAHDTKAREDGVAESAQAVAAKEGIETFHPDVHSPISDVIEQQPRAIQPGAVPTALVDTYRIMKNIGTSNGRMSPFATNAFIKSLGPDELASRKVVKYLDDEIKKSGNFETLLPDGQMVPKARLLEQGDELARKQLLNPATTPEQIKEVFDSMRDINTTLDLKPINDVAYAAAYKATKALRDYFINLDMARASAYVKASMAGEVVDGATAVRLAGDDADMERAQSLILDKLKVLWYEMDMASSIAGYALNNKRVWKQLVDSGDLKGIRTKAVTDANNFKARSAEKAKKIQEFVGTLLEVNRKEPLKMRPLMMAFELTGMDIDSLNKLRVYMNQANGFLRRTFVDVAAIQDSKAPPLMVNALTSVVYNNVLSWIVTPSRAVIGNLQGLLMRPANVMLGAAMRGDGQTLHRAWVSYAVQMDTWTKAWGQATRVFNLVKENPQALASESMVEKFGNQAKILELARVYADAEAAKGNFGPSVRYNITKILTDWGNHPWFRYSANLMEAADAFTKTILAVGEARARAFDEIFEAGGSINPQTIKEASEKVYQSMFDVNGLITDEAVTWSSREIALNLDNKGSEMLNAALRRMPILKTIVMFPRTSMNDLAMLAKYSPLSQDLAALKNVQTVEEMAEFMAKRGAEFSHAGFETMKSEIYGRVAMGSMFTMGAAWLALSGKINGSGIYDPNTRKFQRNIAGFQPQTIELFGKRVSYANLGPISMYLSLAADITTNFNLLGISNSEYLFRRLMFTMGGAITSRSVLQGLQPLFDILSGNEDAAKKWFANTSTMLIPQVSLLRGLGNMLNPGLREVDSELWNIIRNRANFVDAAGMGEPLPMITDVFTGEPIDQGNPIESALNALSPFKVSDKPSKLKQFLIDAEYSGIPRLSVSSGGVKYTPAMKADLGRFMGMWGRDKPGGKGELERRIEAMADDPRWRKEIAVYRQARKDGISSEQMDLSKSNLHLELGRIFSDAVEYAEFQLKAKYPEIRQGEYNRAMTQTVQRGGDLEAIKNILDFTTPTTDSMNGSN